MSRVSTLCLSLEASLTSLFREHRPIRADSIWGHSLVSCPVFAQCSPGDCSTLVSRVSTLCLSLEAPLTSLFIEHRLTGGDSISGHSRVVPSRICAVQTLFSLDPLALTQIGSLPGICLRYSVGVRVHSPTLPSCVCAVQTPDRYRIHGPDGRDGVLTPRHGDKDPSCANCQEVERNFTSGSWSSPKPNTAEIANVPHAMATDQIFTNMDTHEICSVET